MQVDYGTGGVGRSRQRLAALGGLFFVIATMAVLHVVQESLPAPAGTTTSDEIADTAAAATPADVATLARAAEAFVVAGIGIAFPGAALAAGTAGRVEHVVALGRIGWRDASPAVSADSTLYDLASLTKAMATTIAVLILVQDGRIGLDEPVRRHLPEFEGRWKDRVTWRHLLTHTSGLPAGAVVRGRTDAERARRLLRTRLGVPPGVQVTYSDVGYHVLWEALKRAADEPPDRLLERRVWQPLGMNATRFAPGRDCEWCAPTLRLRTGEPFRGVPSDPLARGVGGVTGNAGLFSTITDVARFAAMAANGGELDGERVLEPILHGGLMRQQPGAGRRTLGWVATCPDEQVTGTEPCREPAAFGHNGYTGTSIWIDPATRRWVVLLTNRTYERAARPYPLEPLRRDLFLHVTGRDTTIPRDRWLRPDTAGTGPVSLAPPRRRAPRSAEGFLHGGSRAAPRRPEPRGGNGVSSRSHAHAFTAAGQEQFAGS